MQYIRFMLIVWVVLNFGVLRAQPYTRVVSLAPSISNMVYTLKAQDVLVGCTNYCTIAKNDNKSVVATPAIINIEKVLSVNPDLVIATSITNPESIQMLERFDIRVEVFHSPTSFDAICQQYMALGEFIGQKERSRDIVAIIRDEIDDLIAVNNTDLGKKIFIQIGAEPLYTVIPNTFMNDYIRFAHAENIAHDFIRGTINRETVIERDPDFIFIVTMGINGHDEKEVWEKFKEMRAVKNNQIFILKSDLACTPTPHTFLKTMKIIADCMKTE